MRLEYLDYINKVVEYGSISAAAKILYITPQGLSQAIQQLERELCVPIFSRNGNRLRLTAYGEDIYIASLELQKTYQELKDKLAAHESSQNIPQINKLTILSSPAVNMTFLSKVLKLFHKDNPKVSVQVLETPPVEMLDKLQASGNQNNTILIFCLQWHLLEKVIKDKPVSLNFYEIYRCPLMACVSKTSLLAGKSRVYIEDFLDKSLIIYNLDDKLIDQISDGRIPGDIMLQTCNLAMCRSIIAGDQNAIGVTTEIIEQNMKNNALVSIKMEPQVDMVYGYMLNPEDIKTPSIRSFIDILWSVVNT